MSTHKAVDECFDGIIKSGVFKNLAHYRAAPLIDLGMLADYQKEFDYGESDARELRRRSFDIVIVEEDGRLWLIGFHCDK